MKEKILLLIFVLMVCNCSVHKEEKKWKYLNQIPPGEKAELFAPEIINHMAHSSPTFSPDGKEIYWSTVSGQNETRKIYSVKYENQKWSKPKVVSFSGEYHDDQPFVSSDGQKLFFASKRPKTTDGKEENDIWILNKTNQGWGEPKPIDNLIGFWTPTLTQEGTLYYLDIISGYKGNRGIFKVEWKDKKYSMPEFLPDQINQKDALDWCPFISPDESYLIFSSDREGGFGSGDLYISFRDQKGEWTIPINMGQTVNTDKQERFPGVSPDGKYLFFTRWYKAPYYHDLYWIDSGIIKRLRNQVFN